MIVTIRINFTYFRFFIKKLDMINVMEWFNMTFNLQWKRCNLGDKTRSRTSPAIQPYTHILTSLTLLTIYTSTSVLVTLLYTIPNCPEPMQNWCYPTSLGGNFIQRTEQRNFYLRGWTENNKNMHDDHRHDRLTWNVQTSIQEWIT